ncbi:Tad domain-containing protein [Marivita geojedonensis]|uniref:Tad domain-containing protein n=1 Tax=Marivita geojedonensis TaxID=1123756 RepID=UPI000D42BFF4|nr:Tad domain-containing protein [Marivita geojedonensis]PRY72915.1 putative Flp pilus-assembly TadE/G-like protein [Marivita geojedonensis]
MSNLSREFTRSEDGYVLVLVLLFLPVFFGIALLVIDVARGNNAHSDLQAAADSVAIAGAVELNKEPDAIDRAKAAMAEITNTVSMLRPIGSDVHIDLTYADSENNEFTVHFLRDIPASDDTAIDSSWISANETSDWADAEYVHVLVQSENLSPVFPNPLTGAYQSVPVAARAVATNPGPVTCDVTPVFICNPFQDDGPEYSKLANAMNDGRLHGRLISLIGSPNAGDPAGPGNWGYLRTQETGGANVLRAAMAGDNPVCYYGDTVDTKPGKTASVRQGLNTRFGVYSGPMNDSDAFPPDVNINEFLNSDGDVLLNEVMAPPGGAGAAAGASIGTDSNWNLRGECRDPTDDSILFRGTKANDGSNLPVDEAAGTCTSGAITGEWEPGYWELAHGKPWDDYLVDDAPTDFNTNLEIRTTYPNEDLGPLNDDTLPSRFDIYRFELEQGLELAPVIDGEADRREMFAAIINCDGLSIVGDTDDMPVLSFATFFLPNRMDGPQESLSLEIIDVEQYDGSTSLDELWRIESYLVR